MKRWQKVLIITVAVLLIIAGGVFWAMNKAVNKVLEAVSSDVLSSMNTPIPQPTDSPVISSSPTTGASSEASIEPTLGNKEVLQQQPTPPESTQTTLGASVSSSPEAAITSQPASTPYDPNISADKAKQAQEDITLKEKLQITSIFMKRFSTKELDAFMKLASGGLSHEEKIEAKKLVLEKLSEEEYNQLIDIAARLGLSEGKKYSESEE